MAVVLLASILIKCSTGSVMANNSTDDLLSRHKRTLIYNINGGIAKVSSECTFVRVRDSISESPRNGWWWPRVEVE